MRRLDLIDLDGVSGGMTLHNIQAHTESPQAFVLGVPGSTGAHTAAHGTPFAAHPNTPVIDPHYFAPAAPTTYAPVQQQPLRVPAPVTTAPAQPSFASQLGSMTSAISSISSLMKGFGGGQSGGGQSQGGQSQSQGRQMEGREDGMNQQQQGRDQGMDQGFDQSMDMGGGGEE